MFQWSWRTPIFLLPVIIMIIIIGPFVANGASNHKDVKCSSRDCSGKAGCATITSSRSFGELSRCFTFRKYECIGLNQFSPSSVDSHGGCVRLYDFGECEGPSVDVKPGGAYQGSWSQFKAAGGKYSQSVSSCNREPPRLSSDTRYEKCDGSDCSGKSGCVSLYQHRNFGGWAQCLTFRGEECITLNDWWTGAKRTSTYLTREFSRVSGANSHGTCVRLYSHPGCSGVSLEVKPGTSHHGYLNLLHFEDVAKSVSSCKREPYEDRCHVKHLFSKNIHSKEVSSASADILETMDGIASLVLSGFSLAIPGLDLFYSGLKFIGGSLFNSESSTEALIDAKVEESFARNSASQISAKMHVINSRLTSLLSKGTPEGHRISDLGLALHSCQEVKRLFEDRHYSFSQSKLVSSPYLVAFSSVYLAVAGLVIQMRPEMRNEMRREMEELAKLNGDYMEEAIRQRRAKFTWDSNSHGYSIEDRLLCKPFVVFKGRAGTTTADYYMCELYGRCEQLAQCEECLALINKSVDKEIRAFFQPVIAKLGKFP